MSGELVQGITQVFLNKNKSKYYQGVISSNNQFIILGALCIQSILVCLMRSGSKQRCPEPSSSQSAPSVLLEETQERHKLFTLVCSKVSFQFDVPKTPHTEGVLTRWLNHLSWLPANPYFMIVESWSWASAHELGWFTAVQNFVK